MFTTNALVQNLICYQVQHPFTWSACLLSCPLLTHLLHSCQRDLSEMQYDPVNNRAGVCHLCRNPCGWAESQAALEWLVCHLLPTFPFPESAMPPSFMLTPAVLFLQFHVMLFFCPGIFAQAKIKVFRGPNDCKKKKNESAPCKI